MLEYFLPYYGYDLTYALYYTVNFGIDSTCISLLVRAINEDTNRFRIDEDFRIEHDYAFILLNYGLSYKLIEKIVPEQFLRKHIEYHKVQCEALKRCFQFVTLNDVFSLLKQFFPYDPLP